MIIAIDGPAAAGKGTLARALARHFGLAYLETGSLYRAVGLRVLRAGGDPDDPAAAEAAARNLQREDLDDPELRNEATGVAASKVAAIPQVREVLVSYQRGFAKNPPGDVDGALLEGRDIGSVVCPEADVKLFVTASNEARARRRYEELRARGIDITEAKVLSDLETRDRRDTERVTSPLVPAPDAYLLDTTNLDIDSALREAKALILKALSLMVRTGAPRN